MTQLVKEYFDQKLNEQTKDLKVFAREQTEELARIVKTGFDGVDRQLATIVEMLDVRKDVEQLKLDMKEIRHALNIDR